jgi:glycosyltransferase involved in cell wall biosynthesis
MLSLAESITRSSEIQLSVCTTYHGTDILKLEEKGITYYLIPRKRPNSIYDKSLEVFWPGILNEFNPDLVHIHGTEYAHALACMNSCPKQKYVISIQGLINASSEFFLAGLRTLEILRHVTLHDLIKMETLISEKKKFEKRGQLEAEYLNRTRHIIGRTDWDYAHTKIINPRIDYHMCHETLRSGFYSANKWDLTEKKDFTIFLSQAAYPLKGLHQAIKALALVKKRYPMAHLRVAGLDITKSRNFKEKLKIGGYASFIKSLIKKLDLRSDISFTGILREDEMISEFRKSHVFVCPSSIENSSNSIAEAQLLGTPCVAAFVGGIPSLIKHGDSGMLYRFDDHIMLAYHIMKIFDDEKLALRLSQHSIEIAEKRHNRDDISKHMLEIYLRVKDS